MKNFPIIDGERVILRKFEIDDFDNYFDYVNDEKIIKQFQFNYDKESCKKRLEELVQKYEGKNKPFIWVIALKDTNELIGVISVDSISYNNKRFSLAYGIRKAYRGNNYAYFASYSLINYIFNNFDMHRLELAHNIDNIPSQRTIEKLGAKFEGIARESKYYDNKYIDRKIYSILRNEWLERNNNEV